MNKVAAFKKHVKEIYRRHHHHHHKHLDVINGNDCKVCQPNKSTVVATAFKQKEETESEDSVKKRVFCCFTQVF